MNMEYTKNKLIYGWGVNDVDYNVQKYEVVNGKRKRVWVCPYYQKWFDMLRRCFDLNYQERNPTYKDCTVAEEWRYLSNFIKWVDSQPNKRWRECELDKDFLSGCDKHYSPDTAWFVSKKVNKFILDCGEARGDHLIGTRYTPHQSKKNPYSAQCQNPFGRGRYIGRYSTELEAHKAWQAKKHEYACQLADMQEDERVAKALRERYAPDKDWK